MISFEVDEQRRNRQTPEQIEHDEWRRKSEALARAHCHCGRFAKSGRNIGVNVLGEYEWTVICKAHGEVWMS